MKKLDRKSAIALSLFFALITAYAWNVTTANRVARARSDGSMRRVLVATAREKIDARTTVRPGMVHFEEMDEVDVPEGALTNANEVYTMVTRRTIDPGTVITRELVDPRGSNLGLSYDLPPNMRAVAVPLDPVTGVAGFVKPGDHVDVLATFTGNGVDITRTVLQDVKVIAVGSRPINTVQYQGTDGPAVNGGQDPNQAQADAPTATLAVWPEQAQSLVLAAAKARIHLSLRSPDDAAPTPLAPTTTGKVFGFVDRRNAPAQAAAPAPAPPPAPSPVAVRETAPPPPVRQYNPPPVETPQPAPPAPVDETLKIGVIRGTEQTQVEVPK